MGEGHDVIGILIVVGNFSSLYDSETFLSIFAKQLISENMFPFQLAPHLIEIIHVQLSDKR